MSNPLTEQQEQAIERLLEEVPKSYTASLDFPITIFAYSAAPAIRALRERLAFVEKDVESLQGINSRKSDAIAAQLRELTAANARIQELQDRVSMQMEKIKSTIATYNEFMAERDDAHSLLKRVESERDEARQALQKLE